MKNESEYELERECTGIVEVRQPPILSSIARVDVHHIWSCADKGAKDSAGRFYKEPNVEGLGWTLDQLATDLDEVLGLVAVLVSMNGD